MNDKFKQTKSITQLLPAGVALNDHNIEFVGCPEHKTVIWIRSGNAHSFDVLPDNIFKSIKELFLTDHEAVKILPNWFPEAEHNLRRLIEIYTYYMYGQLDSKADVIDGEIQDCENFRASTECISLSFIHKQINIGTCILSPRDLQILDAINEGLPDKMIAYKQGIAMSTLDFHKRNLFKRIGASTKTEALKLAYKHQVVC